MRKVLVAYLLGVCTPVLYAWHAGPEATLQWAFKYAAASQTFVYDFAPHALVLEHGEAIPPEPPKVAKVKR